MLVTVTYYVILVIYRLNSRVNSMLRGLDDAKMTISVGKHLIYPKWMSGRVLFLHACIRWLDCLLDPPGSPASAAEVGCSPRLFSISQSYKSALISENLPYAYHIFTFMRFKIMARDLKFFLPGRHPIMLRIALLIIISLFSIGYVMEALSFVPTWIRFWIVSLEEYLLCWLRHSDEF